MRNVLYCCLAIAGVVALGLWMSTPSPVGGAEKAEMKVVHDVYFTLKDSSPENKARLVAACKKYLPSHPGVKFFFVGTLAAELKREVNDRDWDVGLHIVFDSKANHDKYQDAPLHKQFIDENKDNWKKVRVFDTLAE
jgi:hypothetical protein